MLEGHSACEPGSLRLAAKYWCFIARDKDPGQARARQQGTLRYLCGLSGNAWVRAVFGTKKLNRQLFLLVLAAEAARTKKWEIGRESLSEFLPLRLRRAWFPTQRTPALPCTGLPGLAERCEVV